MTSEVVVFHIIMGAFGLIFGAAALAFHKGSRLHRAAGNVFFVTMIAMAASGAYLAYFVPTMLTVVIGVLTLYFVATAWATVMRKEGAIGIFEYGAAILGSAIAAAFWFYGWQGANSATGMRGVPAVAAFVFGMIATLAAISDTSVILRRGVSGAQRIARHLWRMCAALLIAAFSFFLGQADTFPAWIRDMRIASLPILAVPPLVVVSLLFYWLVRVLFMKWLSREGGAVGLAASDSHPRSDPIGARSKPFTPQGPSGGAGGGARREGFRAATPRIPQGRN